MGNFCKTSAGRGTGMRHFLFIGTLLVIVLRPFFAERIYPNYFFFYAWMVLLLGLLHWIFHPRTRQLLTHPLMRVWWLWVILVIGSLWTHPSARFDWQKWASFTLNGIFFLLSASYAQDHSNRQWLIAALLGAFLGTMVLVSLQWSVIFPYLKIRLNEWILSSSDRGYLEDFLSRKRILGPFFSPDLFASYLVMIFFVSMAFLLEMKKKFFTVIPLAVIVGLFLTRSLGAWVALTAGLILLSKLQPRLRFVLHGAIILLLWVGMVLWIQRAMGISQAGSLHHSVVQRLHFWKSSWEMFCYSPFWGVGFTRFGDVYPFFQGSGAFETRYAHNIILHLLAEFGLIGGIWFFYWMVVFVHTAKQSLKESSENNLLTHKMLLVALIVFFIHNLVDFSFSIPQVSDHWWIIAGLLQNSNESSGLHRHSSLVLAR